ncbi:MAG: beta-lactamase family protein, partial [Opitutaceae bacterium]|nr:beta-lactamase family protein [Opitutaceae bacterium]
MDGKIFTWPFLLLAIAPFLRAGQLADAVQPYVDNNTLSGAVLLVADRNAIIACEPVGYADLENKTPMRDDTLFWIASMTKPVTAVCMMMLVDEGKVALDDPVEIYIPSFKAVQKIVSQDSEKLNVTNVSSKELTVGSTSRKTDKETSRR